MNTVVPSLISPSQLARALGLPQPTEEQAAVIAAAADPALVVAGAGAGKTETMAARVVWLVANGLVTPDRVLGLTFTRKAARQLADRVRIRLRMLANSALLEQTNKDLRAVILASEPTVLTYHAYAGRLVAEHGLRIPVEPDTRLLSQTACWQLAHQVVSTWVDDLNTDLVPATVTGYLLRLAGELAEHLVQPEQVRKHAEQLNALIESAAAKRAELPVALREIMSTQRFRAELLPLLEAYTARKRKENALDFADQMALAAQLTSEHPEVVEIEKARYGAILLDEYQDTGHAQRILLRALFSGRAGTPITAVGDPAQAIYGWRGASAANLPRFTTDFPRHYNDNRLEPSTKYGLLTSFRNPPEVLAIANALSGPLRAAGLDVDELRAKPGAQAGDISCALLSDVHAELDWLAEQVAARWRAAVEATGTPPTAAVLVRRRADMAGIAAALRARGLPVEVVGLGGLLDEPEVRDLVSALRVLVDPLAGTAAARLLTGSRWRLGAADLAALWRRAKELAGPVVEQDGDTLDMGPSELVEQIGLVDAIDDPGEQANYSVDGYRRIKRLGGELAALRKRLMQPLPELVAETERTLLLNVEVESLSGAGRAHLDAFADVVVEYAKASPTANILSFLDYLNTAEHAEDGLEPGEVAVADDRVQILTVHAAKGLEWQLVAVPHLVRDVFPGRRKSSCWLRSVTELPVELRGDAQDLPRLTVPQGADRKEVSEALALHAEEFEERRLIEERRLCYVALTRSERTLLASGHWWTETAAKPKGPSPFLVEIRDAVLRGGLPQETISYWADPPAEEETNPLAATTRSMRWPVDPLGERRSAVTEGAAMVLTALAKGAAKEKNTDPADDPEGWGRDVDVLLEERASNRTLRETVVLPKHLSVSQLVELAAAPDALASRLRRPLPVAPSTSAHKGTTFHSWLEQRFNANRLIEWDDLPGFADEPALPEPELIALRDAFLSSVWANRTPYDVEVPFETDIAGVTIRGRLDAVFADPDGGWTVVDWKTGAIPDQERLPHLTVQLATYRLAWAALSGSPVDQVRAAFHYVRQNHTLHPADLLDAQGLHALLAAVPSAR